MCLNERRDNHLARSGLELELELSDPRLCAAGVRVVAFWETQFDLVLGRL